MGAEDFRRRLASAAGDDRYLQFLRALNGGCRWRGRFLYWQEVLLAKLGVVAPSPADMFERIEPMLRVCELHGVGLRADPSGLARRCRGAITEYTLAGAREFPNTDCGPLIFGRPFENVRHGVWYCPECRAAEALRGVHGG